MRFWPYIAVLSALAYCATPLHAETVDPLWPKTLAAMTTVDQWSPQDIDSVAETGTTAKPIHTTLHLAGWSKNRPRYDETPSSVNARGGHPPKLKDVEFIQFNEIIAEVRNAGRPVKMPEQQTLHGKNWTVFELVPVQNQKKGKITVWVDTQTGLPHQMQMETHEQQMTVQVGMLFETHKVAGTLPKRLEIDMLSLPTGAKQHAVITSDNWIVRPH